METGSGGGGNIGGAQPISLAFSWLSGGKVLHLQTVMAEHNDLGKWGEEVAACYLENHGYIIKDRDWRLGKRDLDIVAITETQDLLVIVEVKTRSEGLTIDPILAVDETKMRNLAIAANAYVKQMGIDADVRFDIITVVGMDSRHCDVIHTEDAFNPLLLSR